MRHLDLCSGIGGFSLAFESEGFETVGFAELDPYCSQVLKKNWPDVPNYGNVKEIANDPTTLPKFDILTAGYPCQPFSSAGQRKGSDDPRHIWPDIRRVVQARRPSWCVFENVLGHVSMGIDEVFASLEDDGYQTEAFVVPAVAVDAHHRRDRVWIVAHTDCPPQQGGGISSRGETKHPDPILSGRWEAEPNVGRVADGIPDQSHRLKSLGNAIVPQVARRIAHCIRLAA